MAMCNQVHIRDLNITVKHISLTITFDGSNLFRLFDKPSSNMSFHAIILSLKPTVDRG